MARARQAQMKKDWVIRRHMEARRKLREAVTAVPPVRRDDVCVAPWSANDLPALFTGWDVTNRVAVSELLAGQMPTFLAAYEPDWQTYNTSLVQQYRREDFTALLAGLDSSHQSLIDLLETVPAPEFDKNRSLRFKRRRVTISWLIQAQTSDQWAVYEQLQAWAGGTPLIDRTYAVGYE